VRNKYVHNGILRGPSSYERPEISLSIASRPGMQVSTLMIQTFRMYTRSEYQVASAPHDFPLEGLHSGNVFPGIRIGARARRDIERTPWKESKKARGSNGRLSTQS
jgi:hypothetical protein